MKIVCVFEEKTRNVVGSILFRKKKRYRKKKNLNRGPSDLKSHVAQLSWTAFGMFLEWKFGLEQV